MKKNLPTDVFGAPQCGPFRTNRGVCRLAKNGPILNFFQQFLVQNQNSKWVYFMEKTPVRNLDVHCKW